MDQNPYEAPRTLSPPSPRSAEEIAASKRLRTFGVRGGLACGAAFVSLMSYLWRNNNDSLLNTPAFQYAAFGCVALIAVGLVTSLGALIAGNAATMSRKQETPDSSARVAYSGWIVAGVIVAVLCLLVWLATRDPLSIPAG